MSLLGLKLVMLLIILAAGWIGALLPELVERRPNRERLLSWGNAFAAGLFLGTGLIHLLPEASHSWASLDTTYPLAALLAASAFIAILLIEHVLLPEPVHAAAHSHTGEPAHTEQAVSAYALVIALSIHSVLAGVVLGAEAAMTGTILTFAAIVSHKATAGLALGITLKRDGVARPAAARLTALFAFATPAGIILGMITGSSLRPLYQLSFDAAASSLAAGTFLYIGAFDLLQDEFLKPGSRWTKWLCAATGLAMTALLALWI